MSADLEAQARRTLENLADSMMPTRPSVEDLLNRDARQIRPAQPVRGRWQPLTRVAAAVVLVIGAAVTFAVVRTGSGPSEQPDPTRVASTPTTALPIPTSSVPPTSAPTVEPDVFEGIPWYVPSEIPHGYEVRNTQAVQPLDDQFVNSMTWTSGSAGVAGRLRVRAVRNNGGSIIAGEETVTVHGVNAMATVGSVDGTPSVDWIEQGLAIEVESNIEGLDLVALAERTIVDAATGVSLPDDAVPQGLELVTDPPPAPRLSAPSVSLMLRNPEGNVMNFGIGPNVERDSLATIVAPAALSTLEVIGGRERLVRSSADQSGTSIRSGTSITWFESGFSFSAAANASTPVDQLRSFVAGLRPGSIEDFRALTERATNATLDLELGDMATFDDGIRVGVYELTPLDLLAPAICLQGEAARCTRQFHGLDGSTVTEVNAVLRIDGQLELVYWHLNPASEFSATVSHTGTELPVELAVGTVGTFARIVVPSDTASIELTFTTDQPSNPEVQPVFVDTYLAGP